ncbi:syntaxin-17-like isoform X1 [Choristoneura fumiferana]|uniref:syntaxin-17-like isoform X1 n=1 Tax=Choristoneura fumiferana TaxID=7141 RepID=UPI003D159966
MDEENQLPLKRVELSLSKFNDVAIPHHLELLRQHKANIIKYEESGEMSLVRGEAVGAARAASRLRALLAELGALRSRVRAADQPNFDARTQRSRDLTLKAIMDYLALIDRGCTALAKPRFRESSPMNMCRVREDAPAAAAGSAVSTESVGLVAHAAGRGAEGGDDCDVPVMQLQIDDRELSLSEREAALRSYSALQSELHALHDVWVATHSAASAQREQVTQAETLVDTAAVNVAAGRAHLSAAEKLRAGAYGVGGAVIGAALGGPVGLVVGAKAGAAAVLAGSFLGYCGARMLGHKRQAQLAIKDTPHEPEEEKKTQ